MKRTELRRGKPLRATPDTARLTVPAFKPRKCKACRASFMPTRQMQAVCGPLCAADHARAVAAKQAAAAAKVEKAGDRAKREAMKTHPQLTREVQAIFNTWIRMRDVEQPCISCGKPPGDMTALHAGRDAGHYRSTGSAPHMRFVEANVHAQCVSCNQFKAGNAVDYRIGLVQRIGLAAVEALEADQTPRKYSRDELRALRDDYKARVRAMKKEQA